MNIVSTLKIDHSEPLGKQVESIIAERPDLEKIRCIAVEVGYTDRVMLRDLSLYPYLAVVFTDPDWTSKNRCEPYISSLALHDIVSRVIDYNTCVFARTHAMEIVACIDDLRNLNLPISDRIDKLTWWRVEEDLILLVTLLPQ